MITVGIKKCRADFILQLSLGSLMALEALSSELKPGTLAVKNGSNSGYSIGLFFCILDMLISFMILVEAS